MTLYDAVYEFGVPELLLDESLFDRRMDVPGSAAWIHFPSDYGPDALNRRLFRRGDDLVTGWNRDRDDLRTVCLVVNAILVGVPVEDDLDPGDPEQIQGPLGQHRPEAMRVFLGLGEWLRAEHDRSWLGSRVARTGVTPYAELIYTREGELLDYGTLRMGGVSVRTGSNALTLSDAQAILADVGRGAEPALWDLFLADAASSPDAKYAVLSAAIACEIAAKRTLREAALPEQERLLGLLLERRPPAASLFDEPCKAILGRSLKADQLELFHTIESLFVDRNRIAHGGGLDRLSPEQDLRREVQAAGEAIAWLRTPGR